MVANPIWGALGDRFGRKSMVIRAMLAGAVTLTIMGYRRKRGSCLLPGCCRAWRAGPVQHY